MENTCKDLLSFENINEKDLERFCLSNKYRNLLEYISEKPDIDLENIDRNFYQETKI